MMYDYEQFRVDALNRQREADRERQAREAREAQRQHPRQERVSRK